MQANFHTHTVRCRHAAGEDREYIESAIRAGLRVLGFSDHCPWAFPDGYVSHIRMLPSEMDEYFSSLEALKKEYARDITIYIGFEAEYDRTLNAWQEAFLSAYPLDFLILGQHFLGTESDSFYAGTPTTDEAVLKEYVDLAVEGLSTGKYLYLAHPDLIHYNGPDGIYNKHMLRLCRFLKERHIPIEINVLGLSTHRHYPAEKFLAIAGETGVSAVLGIDAHAPEQLLNAEGVRRAELLARRYKLTVTEPALPQVQ